MIWDAFVSGQHRAMDDATISSSVDGSAFGGGVDAFSALVGLGSHILFVSFFWRQSDRDLLICELRAAFQK